MEYNFRDIEQKWQKRWVENGTYRVVEDEKKKKYYVLNMFPYPSGAGLHVGHPLGYIASDIYARYKRLKGYNVLNPMGYDAYGLPAEQYAIQTGQHPEKTTNENIARYRSQLDKIGFSFDWDREVRTCDPAYYKWTQWAFQRMFKSYFSLSSHKAQPTIKLIEHFELMGTENCNALGTEELHFTASEWAAFSEKKKQEVLMNYRIAYLAETMVNWCPGLGTVLANDEVVNGVSERGGYPVEQRKMRQWCLRVSAYAQRLLDGLDTIDWTDSLKETQRNWIGRSEGTEVEFKVADSDKHFTIFTTRADTMFGVTFMVLAPESELVEQLTTPDQKQAVDEYLAYVKKRTERERQMDHSVTGVFSGSYAINPFTDEKIPIWIAEYVLAGYGTGAIMAVPAHDSRDYAFAKHFGLPIIPLIEGADVSEESYDAKEGIMCNSASAKFSLNGLTVKEAIAATKKFVTEQGLGRVKVNYRLRDAIFSRQRYWGEPFPVYYKDDMPYMIPKECLPLELPEIDKYQPTETGEPPLGRAKHWAWDTKFDKVVDCSEIDNKTVFPLELNTMPGFAGSSAYYLRYMDPKNTKALVSKDADEYWQNVDLYVGGTEHATGHLIYSRFWNKFLYDSGYSCTDEPFKKLINQGMIQGWSSFVFRLNQSNQSNLNNQNNLNNQSNQNNQNNQNTPTFVSYDLLDVKFDNEAKKYRYFYNGCEADPIYTDISTVNGKELDIEKIRQWRPEFAEAEFVLNADGKYIVNQQIEKMSKSKFNVVNPDDICEKYGADTLRLYEMFLGPIEQSKPWDVAGIDGCHRFLKKFWNLVTAPRNNDVPSKEMMKSVHKLIKKVSQDIEAFSYNTSISAFMICVNELTQLKCHNAQLFRQIVVLIAPFAPHIAEELWEKLGGEGSVCDAKWPEWDEKYLVEDSIRLGVAFNGKTRFDMEFAADADNQTIEKTVLTDERAQKYIEGKPVKKVIIVPKRMVNIVI
ncbi:MAG: leucine--tRNA ligase [Prevotella sp.]|nr:leucine--tRNA ligase [Prevotella sp.]